MEVIDGIIGIQAGLMAAVDCDGMSMEEVGVFVRNTPNGKKGEALWLEFTSRRDQPDQAEDYNFVTFMREVIDEAKLPA